jgi:hypothetical protein
MTFDQIVSLVARRLNLTSTTAITRIGESVNEAYKNLCTSMGMQQSAQTTAEATTVAGSNLLTFGPIPIKVQKVMSVFNPAYPKPNLLTEVDLAVLRNMIPGTDPAQNYCIYQSYADRVTVMLDSTASAPYSLEADVIGLKATLNGADVPNFAEGYHDTLVYLGMAIEYDKQEKPDMAMKMEAKYDRRCSELRLFLAKSAYQDIYQGRTAPGTLVVNRLL